MTVIEPTPRIETRRLVLRPAAMADAARIALLANDIDVARMTTRIPHPFGLEHAEAFLQRVETQDITRECVFAIDLDDEGLIGVLGFHRTEAMGPEIGYWLGRPYWGRGLATEAAGGALVWASAEWKRRAVVSGHFADNPASGRVLEKAGFLYTGEVLDRHSTARGGMAPTRMMVWLA
jgi:RimJ/RimL family protein N-acetyltransferase